jgi:serine/threonine protein kinase/TPR repeat protein
MSPELHGRVRDLFDRALERPVADRLAFLQSACPADPEVLQEVTSLLEAHASSESFLDEDTRPTRRIGRYLVTGELGRGAMGIVYDAVDPLIGRKVAIKVIRLQSLADTGQANFFRERLFREARSAGALSHPGIVIVYDVGQEGDSAFIAMERVEGSSLDKALTAGRRFSHAELLDILRQAAAALDHAHRNGVVHRDVKPANIMLTSGVRVKIADFGIAKITSTGHNTLAGLVMGTPSYMSPEQIESQALDGRSDQFSLSVAAFELLTGRRPFHSDSLAALAHMIVYADRPSARALNPALPPAVDSVFRRSLSRMPNDRYWSCSSFVAALEEASKSPEIGSRDISAQGPSPSAPVAKRGVWLRDFLIGSVAMLVLLAGTLFYWFKGKTQELPAAPAITRFLADPQSIVFGSTATLRWDVKGATGVVIDPSVGKVPASGPFEVKPSQSTTYLLTATGPGGKTTAASSVNVTSAKSYASQLCDAAEAQNNAHKIKIAADLGAGRCMVTMGDFAAEANHPGEASKWILKGAQAGDPGGMRDLGVEYYLAYDYKQAAIWYGKAADAGDADAVHNLGTLYENAQGVPRDLNRALDLYRKAAALGNVDSKTRLEKLKGNGK